MAAEPVGFVVALALRLGAQMFGAVAHGLAEPARFLGGGAPHLRTDPPRLGALALVTLAKSFGVAPQLLRQRSFLLDHPLELFCLADDLMASLVGRLARLRR